MIKIITGRPGQGKTLYLAKLVKKELDAGYNVYSWYQCRFNDPRVKYFKDIRILKTVKNATVFLDEMTIWFNSHKWWQLPDEIRYAVQQHRHKGLDVIGNTQRLGAVDNDLRENVEEYWEVNQLLGTKMKHGIKPKRPWGLFLLRRYLPADATRVRRRTLEWKMFFANANDFAYYDTEVNYELEDDTQGTVDVKTCPTCGHKRILWGTYRSKNIEIPKLISPGVDEF
jgi:hypothetical protein